MDLQHLQNLFKELKRVIRELDALHRKSCNSRDDQERTNHELRLSVEEKKKLLKDLQQRKTTLMKERTLFVKTENTHELKRKHQNIFSLQQVSLQETEKVYQKVIEGILFTKVKDYLINILTFTAQKSSELDQRETYKIYGLLLSACKIKEDEKKARFQKDVGKKDEEEYKSKADILTHNMLTLLPPLLVVCNKELHLEFHKGLYDTFRQTWDETKDMSCLYYYRPALVFGNQLSVAVKGLIGNCEQTQILEEPKSNQELVEKQEAIPEFTKPYQMTHRQTVNVSKLTAQCQVCQVGIIHRFGSDIIQKNGQFWHKHHAECYSCHNDLTVGIPPQQPVRFEDHLICDHCNRSQKHSTSTYSKVVSHGQQLDIQQYVHHYVPQHLSTPIQGATNDPVTCIVCKQIIAEVPRHSQDNLFIHKNCCFCYICGQYIQLVNASMLDTGQLICATCRLHMTSRHQASICPRCRCPVNADYSCHQCQISHI